MLPRNKRPQIFLHIILRDPLSYPISNRQIHPMYILRPGWTLLESRLIDINQSFNILPPRDRFGPKENDVMVYFDVTLRYPFAPIEALLVAFGNLENEAVDFISRRGLDISSTRFRYEPFPSVRLCPGQILTTYPPH